MTPPKSPPPAGAPAGTQSSVPTLMTPGGQAGEAHTEDLPNITGDLTVSMPAGTDAVVASKALGQRVVSIVHSGSDDRTIANATAPDFDSVGAAPQSLPDITMDDILGNALTRREGANTREALDEKIRAHLERGDAKKDAKPDPLIGKMIGGRFLVLKKIGSGGMGSVYRARQEGMDRDVAIKVLLGDLKANDTVLRRFTLEALAVSRLRHPNTIQIFDYGQTPEGDPYIAMELLEGTTLYDLLRTERPLPIRRALRIMGQVGQSLAEAHGKEVVHRDLKPENIFLVTVGDNIDYVKVLDFGVAKLRDHKTEGGTLTQAGSIFGTPRYMSPEQCSAQPVDARSDLYTLGVILYEMVTGQAPFAGDQALTLLLAHVNELPLPPSAATDKQIIPAEVEDLVLKLLEKTPASRLQSAGDLAKRCQELADQLPTAFDQRVGSLQEAESLGVRVAAQTTDSLPTARTLRVAGQVGKSDAVAAPELQMPPPASKVPLILGGAIAVVAATVGLWVATRPPEVVVQREIVEKQVAVPMPPAADDMVVRITVNSNPPGAKILRGQTLLGTTNATIDHAKGGAEEAWQLLRDGYAPKQIVVNFATSGLITVDLTALPAVVVPAAGAGNSAQGKQGSGKADPRPAKPETGTPAVVKAEGKAEAPKAEVKAEAPKVEEKKKEIKIKDDKLDDPDLK